MPRRESRIEGNPYAVWPVEVEDQNRIRLSLQIQAIVPWLKSESNRVDCIASPGPAGGVQLEPVSIYEKLRQPFNEGLRNEAPHGSESSRKWVDAARLLASSWQMSISIESGRLSLTLPEPIRRAGLLPGVDGFVVVFGFGDILEIWEVTKWYEHVRALAKTRQSVVSEAIEALEDR
jgi:DNA-binding transcriptional regulator/RsmH inhibitor MraZ